MGAARLLRFTFHVARFTLHVSQEKPPGLERIPARATVSQSSKTSRSCGLLGSFFFLVGRAAALAFAGVLAFAAVVAGLAAAFAFAGVLARAVMLSAGVFFSASTPAEAEVLLWLVVVV